MKRMKKVAALLLALVMVLGMGITTLAATPAPGKTEYGTKGDLGVITVGGIDDTSATLTATAYPIIAAKYDNVGDRFSGYEVLYTTDPAITLPTNQDADDEDANTVSISEEQLTQIRNQITNGGAVTVDGVAGKSYPMTLANGTATATVPVGSYLVVISGAETKVYNPIVASVAYTTVDGKNALDEGAILDISEGQAWVKVTDNPGVEKNIIEEDGSLEKGNSANIGDSIQYVVTIDPVPYYGGKNPKLVLTDTLHDGLIFEGDAATDIAVSVVGGEKETDDMDSMGITDKPLTYGTDYTVAVNDDKNEISINFVVDGTYTLNNYVGQCVQVVYNAKLTDAAVINENPNVNDVVLTFSKDSNVENDDGTDDDKVYSYTFDIDGSVAGSVTKKILTKTGEEIDMTEEDGIKGLQGAEFTLYTDAECTTPYTMGSLKATNGVVTSSKGGQLVMKGLEADTYYLKETKAPDGYSLNSKVFTIVIAASYKDDGQLKDWSISIQGEGDDEATSTFTVDNGTVTSEEKAETTIPNTKLTNLPSTGGIGTTIFTIGGCLIMIIAAGLFFASRRKSSK